MKSSDRSERESTIPPTQESEVSGRAKRGRVSKVAPDPPDHVARDGELATALAVLRLVCGWNQLELARAAGLRAGTISDYERGKIAPGSATVRKLLKVEGFDWADLQKAQEFIRTLRLAKLEGVPAAEPTDRDWEIEKIAAAAGTVASQVVRLLLQDAPSPREV
jgi:transcriptional regulator with XRE-family HTH domain